MTKNRKRIALVSIAMVLIITVLLIFGVFMAPMKIDGSSMSPTLENQQMIFVQKALYKLSYGGVVVFDRPDKSNLVIKRIMGMPNDRIRMVDGKLYRNGVLANDPYNTRKYHMDILVSNDNMNVIDGVLTLGADEFFLLGDNRGNSADSRIYGGVSKNNIIGLALFVK